MPCCGLQEFRVKVPTRLTIAGIALLSFAFVACLAAGLLLAWRPAGRLILRSLKAFLVALWAEALRDPDAAPGRFGARVSGLLLPLSPEAAALCYRRPEVPLLVLATSMMGLVAGAVGAIGYFL